MMLPYRYEYKNFSPAHTSGHAFWYLSKLFFHLYHTLRVTTLRAEHIAKLAQSENRSEELRSLMASMLRTKPVDSGPEDFVSFCNYWNHVTTGGRKPASEFTSRKAPHEHAQWKK